MLKIKLRKKYVIISVFQLGIKPGNRLTRNIISQSKYRYLSYVLNINEITYPAVFFNVLAIF